jgi:CRISPR-associated protein Cmr2
MSTHLHFTFGPVQGFVAQARRTRDLFSGSFLLSWLAYKAMDAARTAGGEISLPDFAAVKKLVETDHAKHAGAPNRFIAEFSDEEAADNAAAAADAALQTEWQKIAAAVWEKIIAPVAAEQHGNGTAAIWNRQIENFWEVAWAIGTE